MNRRQLRAIVEQQKNEEIARRIQFIIGELCYKIENTRTEIRRWSQGDTRSGWIQIHIQNKKQHLKQLFKQKMMYLEGLDTYMKTGEIKQTYEIYAEVEEKQKESLEVTLAEKVIAYLNE